MTMKHRLCFMSGLLLSILVDGAVSWSNCKTCSGEYKYCEYGCCDYNCCPNVVGIILGTVGAAVILSVLLGGVVIYIVQNRYNREPQKNLNTTTPESNTIDTINLPPESRERPLSEISAQNNVAQEPPAEDKYKSISLNLNQQTVSNETNNCELGQLCDDVTLE